MSKKEEIEKEQAKEELKKILKKAREHVSISRGWAEKYEYHNEYAYSTILLLCGIIEDMINDKKR